MEPSLIDSAPHTVAGTLGKCIIELQRARHHALPDWGLS